MTDGETREATLLQVVQEIAVSHGRIGKVEGQLLSCINDCNQLAAQIVEVDNRLRGVRGDNGLASEVAGLRRQGAWNQKLLIGVLLAALASVVRSLTAGG